MVELIRESDLVEQVSEAGFYCSVPTLLGLIVSSAFIVYFLQLFI